jgi:hypothetical protein
VSQRTGVPGGPQGLYFVLTTDTPPCMCVVNGPCAYDEWQPIVVTCNRDSRYEAPCCICLVGLLHAGEVQGSPKCTVNYVDWLTAAAAAALT